jgi:hypothetical protein
VAQQLFASEQHLRRNDARQILARSVRLVSALTTKSP